MEALHVHLDSICEVIPWDSMFNPSDLTVDTLESRIGDFDFAAIILTTDDIVRCRGKQFKAPRDNLLLELGMCIGGIGRRRTFVIEERGSGLKIPSDLAGLTTLRFSKPERAAMKQAIRAVAIEIKERIRDLGIR